MPAMKVDVLDLDSIDTAAATAATATKPEAVNHPSHYGGDTPHEVIKCLHAWGLEQHALLWNVVKYIARAGRKDPAKLVEDLEKARFYLDRAIVGLKAKP